jgi:hypothetical protein
VSNLKEEVRRLSVKKASIWIVVMLVLVGVAENLPLFGPAKRLDLFPTPNFAHLAASFLVGLVLAAGITRRHRVTEGQLLPLVRVSAFRFNWVLWAILGLYIVLPGAVVWYGCSEIYPDDLMWCFFLRRDAENIRIAFGIGIFAWIVYWARGVEQRGVGGLMLEIYPTNNKRRESLRLAAFGLIVLLIALLVLYRIFSIE